MRTNQLKVLLRRDDWHDHVEIKIGGADIQTREDGHNVITPVIMTYALRERTSDAVEMYHTDDEILSIPNSTAQFLMDQLYECGFRPTEAAGSAGSMEAVQKHLLDLQKIVSILTNESLANANHLRSVDHTLINKIIKESPNG